MTHTIDYSSIDFSDSTAPENYHYTERRAEILSLIYEAGSPRRMHQDDLAARYDVNQSTISRDFDALGEFVAETLGDRRVLSTDAVVQRSIRGLLDEDEYRKAAKTAMEWSEWVAREGDLAEMQDQLDALVAATQNAETETGAGVEVSLEDNE